MKKKELLNSIVTRKNNLEAINTKLKQEFVGLDSIIDELTKLVSSWYLFSDAQLRPCVINIWGLTGTGKTALVEKFVELIQYKNLYYRMDMGEFDSDSSSWLKNTFTDELSHFHDKASIICMDEFQFARTVNEDGSEIKKDKHRIIWELIDSGKISYLPQDSSYYIAKADRCINLLMSCNYKGVTIKDGIISSGKSHFKEILDGFKFDSYSINLDDKYFISQDFITGLINLYNDEAKNNQYFEKLVKESSLQDLIRLVSDGIKTRLAYKCIDLSKSVIFVLGNLDEAYYMSSSLNPDISADELHKLTCEISIIEIKSALRKRFRSEQVARLGNNHIIYRAFTNEQFKEIINRRLLAITKNLYHKFRMNVKFDDSVTQVIYIEGVIPAQGTRPVFTTINNYVESNISKVLVEFISLDDDHLICVWVFNTNHFEVRFIDSDCRIVHSIKIPILLKITELRNNSNIHLQAFTAVHESGHAIVSALVFKIVPTLIISKAVDAQIEGFCMTNVPYECYTLDIIKKNIMVGIAGYVAEKMIFGPNNTSSGVSNDLARITDLASKAIKNYGMGRDTFLIKYFNSSDNSTVEYEKQHGLQIKKIIEDCELKATELLRKNKLLLLKMSEYLSHNPRMEEKEIKNMIVKYSTEKWVNENSFIKPEELFTFYNTIKNQLDELNVLKEEVRV